MHPDHQTNEIAALTVQLLSAYLTNNTVDSRDLASLIRSTRAALTLDEAAATTPENQETFTPAVSVRKSLSSSEHVISLIDGKPYKTLKRHLASHGLTPDQYRSRYDLPASYPMVAPAYAARRRAIAQDIGLGTTRGRVDAANVLAALDPSSASSAAQGLTAAEPQEHEPGDPVAATPRPDKHKRATAQPKRGSSRDRSKGTEEHANAPTGVSAPARDSEEQSAVSKGGVFAKTGRRKKADGETASAELRAAAGKHDTAQSPSGEALQSGGEATSGSGTQKRRRRTRLTLFKDADKQGADSK